MSYKKFNDLQNLYEGVVSESNEIDEYTELVYNVIIAEMVYRGHSESVIETYLENISEEQILEKVESFFSLEEYNLNEEQTDLLFSFYQDQQLISESGGLLKFLDKGKHLSKLKNLKNVNVLKNIKGSGAKLKNMIMSLVGKGKGSTKQLNLDLKGAKDGPGLLQKLKNLKTSTGKYLSKQKSKFDKKVTKTSDTLLGPDGKPLKTTKTVNPFNKKNAAIAGGLATVGGVATLTGGGKKKDNSSDNLTDKDKNDINKENQLNNVLNNKDKLQQLETKPKKKNAAGVEMTGSGTKDDPWISKAVKVKDVHIPMTDPRNPHYYKGIEKGLPNKEDWLKKTANSPAAKAFGNSDEANERRWQTQLKHREWQDKNNRGAFKVKKEKPKSDTYTTNIGAFLNNKKKGDVKDKSRHTKVTSVMDMESYDAKGEVLDEDWKKIGVKAVQYGAEKNIPGTGILAKGLDKLNKLTSKKSKDSKSKDSERPKPKPKKDVDPKMKTVQDSYDAYDLVLNYIMETEQASTIEEANYIMIEMDQNTIHEIVEEQKKTLGEGLAKLVGLGAAGYGLWKAGKWAKKKGDKALDDARKNMKIGGENRKKEIGDKSGVDLDNW